MDEKRPNPMVDWLLSIGVLIGIVIAIAAVFSNPGMITSFKEKLFTKQGMIVAGIVIAIVTVINGYRYVRKLQRIREEINERMAKDWGRKKF